MQARRQPARSCSRYSRRRAPPPFRRVVDSLTEEGEHSQAAVLQLLQLQLGQLVGVLAHAHGVEGAAGVALLLLVRLLVAQALGGRKHDELL